MNENLDNNTFNNFLLGDINAFERIYRKHYASLVTFTNKYIESQEEREDITNEVFIALYNNRQRFKDELHVKSFLFLSARNRCLNYLKSKKRRGVQHIEIDERIQDDTLLKYEYMIRAEVIKSVHEAIENLPDDCRRIFKMLFYEELKPAEIAAMLNISVNNVYVQKSNAIRALKVSVGQSLPAIALLLRIISAVNFSA